MFISDYNNDGLKDMLVFYNGGYIVFWNQGNGITNSTFSNSNVTWGTNIGNVWMIREGDFNGDGLPDFIMNDTGESQWYFALNNGNGTFTKQAACTLAIYDQSFTSYDDDKFNCYVYDFDFDGKSDVVINKAMYTRGSDLFGEWGIFNKTHTYWMRSTGSALSQVAYSTSNKENDALSSHYVLGDFNGGGQVELMNYGYACNSGNQTNPTSAWRLYRNNNYNTNSGKVTSIINEYGDTISASYASLANSGIYTKRTDGYYPVANYTLPVHAVKTVTAAGMTTNYEYSGLKGHQQGRGLLGMTTRKATNTTLGTATTDSIGSWHPIFYVPDKTYRKTSVNGQTAEAMAQLSFANKGSMRYFAYPSSGTEKDLDGNYSYTAYQYNTDYGYMTQEKTRFDNNNDQMYKTVQYSNYTLAGGRYQPQTITQIQKHADDASPFTKGKYISYYTSGLPEQVIENYETLPLITEYVYDAFGNMTSSQTYGDGVSAPVNHTVYDATKRFVAQTYTTPASEVRTYTYDTWGNVLTEKDETNSGNILTTTHTYDNWGNRTTTTSPGVPVINYHSGWNSDPAKRFYTLVQGGGQPWIKTWYDYHGREVLTETAGSKNVSIKKSKTYNAKGQLEEVKTTKGALIAIDNYTYDSRGRLSSQNSSSSGVLSYIYGNRSETIVRGYYLSSHRQTKTYDAWGNIKTSTDPSTAPDSVSVIYTYRSLGKPKEITTGGATFSMTYNNAGFQETLTDPNAGTITYLYDELGRVRQQTDARGNVTVNEYDVFGRLDYSTLNEVMTDYTYGTSGNNKLRLTSIRTGNDTVSYSYDYLGRVIQERKHGITFGYAYNAQGQLSSTTLPATLENVQITREYDNYGNLLKVKAGTQDIWELTGETGLATTTKLGGTMTATATRDKWGWLTGQQTVLGSTVLHSMGYRYNSITGNLIARAGMISQIETFVYDNLDRLTAVQHNDVTRMSMTYQSNGNIGYKTGAGEYGYDPSQPHAATWVSNEGMVANAQEITYTAFNKVSSISGYLANGYPRTQSIEYGPTQERKALRQGNTVLRTYAGDYEQVGTNVRYYIYGGDGLAAIYTRPYRDTPLPPNTPPAVQAIFAPKIYYAHKDHLGSIVKLTDGSGTMVFKASYDVWGKQTITTSTFASYRGYTGHEHLPDFGLINMNGRVYDPVLARFLSPDPYVQAPDFSQNFNRYSYCLNNPLIYTDPSGEFIFSAFLGPIGVVLDGMCWGAVIGAGTGAVAYSIGAGISGNWSWSSLGSAMGMGAVGGAIGGGFGALGGVGAIGSFGNTLGYNILSQTSSNIITSAIYGNDITLGSVAGSLVGGLVGSSLPNFNAVQGGAFNNAMAEIGFNSLRGATTGLYSGITQAIIDKNPDAAWQNVIGGAIGGASSSVLNIAAFGAAYKPHDTYYSHDRRGEGIYRKGGLLLKDGYGITWGRSFGVTGEGADLVGMEVHESTHMWQQNRMGWANFYGKTIKSYVSDFFKYGTTLNLYGTHGTLEWQADESAKYYMRYIYTNP